MIVTLTANPSIDRTVDLTGPLERGGVLRASGVTSQSAGKGVNISRAAVAAGVPTVATLLAEDESTFVRELRQDGIDCRPAPPAGPIRVNLTLTEPGGVTTKINAPGATVDGPTLDRLAASVLDLAGDASWVVLAGSLPPGAPEGWYAELCVALADLPAQVAVDTSEGPLLALADRLEDARPDLLKPNADELSQLTGRSADDIEADPATALLAAGELVGRGAGAVLATLGARGAVLASPAGAWLATPPPTRVVSTVGAGDSSLFGYLLGVARGEPEPDRLRRAVAYGSAAAGLPGTTIPRPDQTHPDLVAVDEIVTRAQTAHRAL